MAKERVNLTWRPIVEQTAITSSASSQQSAAFGAQTYAIRIAAATANATYGIHFSIGFNPTATANSPYLAAGGVEYIGVNPGEKVAILDDTGALKVSITELSH
jgi:hypothetical protein